MGTFEFLLSPESSVTVQETVDQSGVTNHLQLQLVTYKLQPRQRFWCWTLIHAAVTDH